MVESADERPPVWTGHVAVVTSDVAAAARFFELIGMRRVAVGETFAALEMRGGTHLLIQHDPEATEPGPLPWDLMVDDVDATHATWRANGLAVTEVIDEAPIPHRRFEVTDPDGHVLVVRDSHVAGVV